MWLPGKPEQAMAGMSPPNANRNKWKPVGACSPKDTWTWCTHVALHTEHVLTSALHLSIKPVRIPRRGVSRYGGHARAPRTQALAGSIAHACFHSHMYTRVPVLQRGLPVCRQQGEGLTAQNISVIVELPRLRPIDGAIRFYQLPAQLPPAQPQKQTPQPPDKVLPRHRHACGGSWGCSAVPGWGAISCPAFSRAVATAVNFPAKGLQDIKGSPLAPYSPPFAPSAKAHLCQGPCCLLLWGGPGSPNCPLLKSPSEVIPGAPGPAPSSPTHGGPGFSTPSLR